VVWPFILREIVQTVDETSEVAVGEKTERAWDLNRIIEPLCRNIRLTDQCHTRHRSAFKLSLHRCERDRLVMTNHLRLCFAGWKGNEERCDQANERSRTQIKSGLGWMKIAQRVERSDRSNDKRAGHDRG